MKISLKQKIIFVIFITFLNIACADNMPGVTIKKQCMKSSFNVEVVNDFILSPFKEELNIFSVDEMTLVKKFGDFKITSTETFIPKQLDPLDKVLMKREVWSFDGISFDVESIASKKPQSTVKYTIKKIVITNNKYNLKLPINIGSTVDDVSCTVGKSRNINISGQGEIDYSTWGADRSGDLDFYISSRGIVNKIVFEYIVD